ncbi:hypothetical protein WDV93_23530 [Pantoea ananatis]
MIYTETGEFAEYLIYPKNPDMVVMDTTIIAKHRYVYWSREWAMPCLYLV